MCLLEIIRGSAGWDCVENRPSREWINKIEERGQQREGWRGDANPESKEGTNETGKMPSIDIVQNVFCQKAEGKKGKTGLHTQGKTKIMEKLS